MNMKNLWHINSYYIIVLCSSCVLRHLFVACRFVKHFFWDLSCDSCWLHLIFLKWTLRTSKYLAIKSFLITSELLDFIVVRLRASLHCRRLIRASKCYNLAIVYSTGMIDLELEWPLGELEGKGEFLLPHPFFPFDRHSPPWCKFLFLSQPSAAVKIIAIIFTETVLSTRTPKLRLLFRGAKCCLW